MKPISKPTNQSSLFSNFADILDESHPLFILSSKINWGVFEKAFSHLYSQSMGRPAMPIRLMVGLLILKHLRNVSDESVVVQWSENVYYQYFCGESYFVSKRPCEASELVHFRKRIGESGIELIFKESILLNGKDSEDENVNIDTTVQEKNITFPTDAKLHKKIIKHCQKISARENLPVRQSYTRTLKMLFLAQRFRNHPKNKSLAKKADKKVKTIAGRLVRELERNLGKDSPYQNKLDLFHKVLWQTTSSKNKIYSLHEPETCCISKGKDHKKYEFGNKASFVKTDSGVIVGALGFRNEYDGHTLAPALEQVKNLIAKAPLKAKVDRGYRGNKMVGETEILIPSTPTKSIPYKDKKKISAAFKKRAGIEPIIGHIKEDHRLKRNFYKGIFGDKINIMLAAAAFNFKRMMNQWKTCFLEAAENNLKVENYQVKTLKAITAPSIAKDMFTNTP